MVHIRMLIILNFSSLVHYCPVGVRIKAIPLSRAVHVFSKKRGRKVTIDTFPRKLAKMFFYQRQGIRTDEPVAVNQGETHVQQ